MHHLLRDSAQKFPDRTAIVQGERRYTYRELDHISTNLAHIITFAKLNRFERVGVFLDHCLEQIFAFYGILKAGGIYVPINSQLMEDQVDHISKDCRLSGMIIDSERIERLKEHLKNWKFLKFLIISGRIPKWVNQLKISVYFYEEIIKEKGDKSYPGVVGIGADLAALLYTSGSTGKPKGVMISHHNLIAGARIVTTYIGNKPDDRLLGVLPLTFDAGLNQVTCSALLGMTYVMKSFKFPGEITETMLKEKITGFAGIPTIWHLLLQLGSPVYKHKFEHLRYLTNTGGNLPVHAVEKLKKVFPETDIFLMYGLTEAFRSTYLPPGEIDKRPTSIGKAIPNTEILVVNKKNELCGPEEVGELVHRGPTVSLGYWGDPERTRKVFKINPFLPKELPTNERVVYSGDLAKKDKQGYLYFVSRDDHMIKCHGHRISPSEIEEVLYAMDRIKLAAAIGISDPIRGQSIKIFIVPQDGHSLKEEDVLSFCAEKLPQFMMPRFVEIKSDLPRTSSGKIDIGRLKKVEKAHNSLK
jgi:acyl-CoA ligase (AMP-forming) (exosortase A-associated)